MSQALRDDPVFQVIEVCASLDTGLAVALSHRPGMVLLDAAIDEGLSAVARIRIVLPEAEIVVVTLKETEENILDWAEAGIAGYVPDTVSMSELPTRLRQIRWGEQSCPSRIAGSLLRSLGRFGGGSRRRDEHVDLTPRERMILRLLSTGLTNKDIARQLDISLSTAKSHVHNILAKLNLRSRSQLAARMGRGLIEDFRA